MLNIEYENLEVQPAELELELEHYVQKGECTRQKLNVARGKLNDESVNSNVKQQMYDKMRKVECKMQR